MYGYPTVPIAITSTPTDWISILSAFFAAFLGAAAAFAFNALERSRNELVRRRNIINNSVYALSATINTLLNLKSQSLDAHKKEFALLLNLVSNLDMGDERAVEQASQIGRGIIAEISSKDPSLNGAFHTWQEIDFLNLTAPEDLAFTVDADTDLVRLLMTSRSEVRQVSKRIVQKNLIHEKMIADVVEDAKQRFCGSATLLFWQQMLKMREIILQHTDVALAVIPVAISQIEIYRIKKLKRSKLATLLLGKERWISFSVGEKFKSFLPDRAAYKDIIEGVD